MKIAMIISGRATSYEKGLLEILKNTEHDVDLFMSINNVDCEYFDIMKERLGKWLKFCSIKEFIYPEDFINNNENGVRQLINGRKIPYNPLSMFYNERIAFQAATKFADENNFEYDYYIKFRADIGDTYLPGFLDENKLLCATPKCQFIGNGVHKKLIVSDAFAWSNRKIMDVYFNTYDFLMKKNKELNNNYYIAYECTVTDNIIENNIEYEYIDIKYELDNNRRMFDKGLRVGHGYSINDENIQTGLKYIDITKTADTSHIPYEKEP